MTPDLSDFYRQMCVIRRLEETLLEMFSAGELVGTTHTCIGQEASAVGVIAHLDPARDTVFSNHRCHGHYVAFTDDVEGLVAEVTGRETGVCSGRGGSQHLCNGNFYSNGIQGSIVPVATGIAFAERAKGTGGISTVFIGDGTLGQGALYESLNMASLWKLPLLVVVENNHYAQSTPATLAVSGSIGARASAFDIATADVDTTDVERIHHAAGLAVEHVRTTGEPFFLVLDTYRFAPHSKGDDTRDEAEIAARRAFDPLTMIADRVAQADRDAHMAAAERRVAAARAAALAAPIAGQVVA